MRRSHRGQKPTLAGSFTHRDRSVACEARVGARHHCFLQRVEAQRGSEPGHSASVSAPLTAMPSGPAGERASFMPPTLLASFTHTRHTLIVSFLFYVIYCVCGHTYIRLCVCRGQRTVVWNPFFLPHMGFGYRTRAVRFGSKLLTH